DEETGAGTAAEETASGQKGGKGREMLDKLRHLFIETDRGERALALVLKYIGKILKSALPRKGTGYVRFGFSEPDVTGKVLAVLCAAFPQKKRGIRLRPEFLESCFECDVTFEGRLILGWLVILLLVLALNRDVLYVIKKLRSK
ncbi:MAG: hypothetical protein J6Z38_07635, partial [Lachnospiraceae bacterium]|nr:hypothetical protein [Lachnospiraceae bacterium]